MDINNQMIMMRKDIKKAKIYVIGKLHRNINLLKNKKGNEKQLYNYKKRAAKLEEELDVIKAIKPDSVFKYLVSSDISLQDLSKQEKVDLRDRVCVRIGLISFIKKRVDGIKAKVNEFDKTRSNKKLITSLKVVHKLTSRAKSTDDTSDQAKDLPKQDDSNVTNSMKQQLKPKADVSKCLPVAASEVKSQNKSKSTKKSTWSDINSSKTAEKVHKQISTLKEVKTVSGNNQAVKTDDRQTKHNQLESDQCSDDDSSNELTNSSDIASENDSNDSFFEKETSLDIDIEDKLIEVVLPDFYSQTGITTSDKEKRQREIDLNDELEHGDVSALFSNAGNGFADSDEEEAAARRKRWANFQSDDEDDFFVVNEKPNTEANSETNARLKKILEMNPTNTHKAEERRGPKFGQLLEPSYEEKRKHKQLRKNSHFLQLNEENRYSRSVARTPTHFSNQSKFNRKRQKGSTHKPQWKDPKTAKKDFSITSASFRKAHLPPKQTQEKQKTWLSAKQQEPANATPIHPSWEASKKKKEQNKILEFKGTRITFDDSD